MHPTNEYYLSRLLELARQMDKLLDDLKENKREMDHRKAEFAELKNEMDQSINKEGETK